ncbi:MAG: hypothetical protein E6J18_15500 [Chloroflexi bacterium]|nr:MAG: hypothetical protein E6J18_15500 [Chloroflexota bacterium]
MAETRLRKRTLSVALIAARVLLGLQALGLIVIIAAFASLELAMDLLAASDTQNLLIFWQSVLFGLAMSGVGLILGGAPLALTFVRRRWSYLGLLAIELLLVVVFVVCALQPASVGLETETDIGRVILVLVAILPSSVCLLLVFRAEVREHFEL